MVRRVVRTVTGRETAISGELQAHWEDDHYERLKKRMLAYGNAPDREINEPGIVHEIITDEDGQWYLVQTSVVSIGHPDGLCEQTPPGTSRLDTFPSEEALLNELRGRLDPDNDMCPVRNLLGDWERFDLLNLWLDELR